MSNPHRSEEEITTILMALVSWAGNCSSASNYLKAEKNIGIAPGTLAGWKHRYADRYDELRDKYREQAEQALTHEFREVALLATGVQRLGLERAMQRLENDRDPEPSKTAANAATVADKMTGKLLALTGRPTSIREDRNLEEILRGLVAKRVLELPSVTVDADA